MIRILKDQLSRKIQHAKKKKVKFGQKEREFKNSLTKKHLRQYFKTKISSCSKVQHSHLPSAEGFFYPQNLACTPLNDEVPNMLLYINGTKIMNKIKGTPNSKCSGNPEVSKSHLVRQQGFSFININILTVNNNEVSIANHIL